MAGFLQRLLSRGSQTAPKVADELTTLKKLAKEAGEEAPEVIGKGTSKAAKQASEEVPDAIWREITPEPKKVSSLDALLQSAKENPKTAAVLASLTGGTAINQFLGGDGGQPPVVPQVPLKANEPILPADYNKLAQDEANAQDIKSAAPKKDGLDFDELSKTFDKAMAGLPKEDSVSTQAAAPEPESFRSLLQAAMAKRDSALNDADFLRLAEKISAGLSRTKAEHGSSDIKREQAETSVKDFQKEMESMQQQQKFDQLQADMADESKMRDPNSEVSRTVSELAIKTGLIKPGQQVSAMTLKNAGVNLGTLLSTIEAGKARAHAAQLSREQRESDTADRIAAKKEEERLKREDKRKLITEEVENRARTMKETIAVLKDKIKDKGTFETFGSHNTDLLRLLNDLAVDTAKLQDPNSVARPGEVEKAKEGLFGSGGVEGLKLSNQTAEDILNNFEKEIEKKRAIGYAVRGLSPDENATPSKTPIPGISDNNFPRQVKNAKGQVATVSNAQELKEAQDEGFN